jgi:hypothetical protein
MDTTQLILKGLGKRKVKSILNQWIKDQVNECLEHNSGISLSPVIWLEHYVDGMSEQDDAFEVDDLFQFIGNKI